MIDDDDGREPEGMRDLREQMEKLTQDRNQLERDVCKILGAAPGEHPISAAARIMSEREDARRALCAMPPEPLLRAARRVKRERDEFLDAAANLEREVERLKPVLDAARLSPENSANPSGRLAQAVANYDSAKAQKDRR